MLSTPDNLILQFLSKVIEIIAVTGNTNDQVLVFFGMLLCIPQGFGCNYIELDMVAIHFKIRPDQILQGCDAFLILEYLWSKFLV